MIDFPLILTIIGIISLLQMEVVIPFPTWSSVDKSCSSESSTAQIAVETRPSRILKSFIHHAKFLLQLLSNLRQHHSNLFQQ